MRRLLALLVVALAAIFVVRRVVTPRPRQRPRTLALLAAWLALLPAHWWDDAWSGVSDIAGAIKDWVLGLVGDVVDWLDHSLRWLGDRVNDAFDAVAGVFDSVSRFVVDLFNSVAGWVIGLVGGIVSWVVGALKDVADFLYGLVMDVAHFLWGLLSDVWDWIAHLPQWLWDNIVTPLWDMIMWVWHNVIEPIADALWSALSKLWEELWGVIRGAWDLLTQLWNFVFGVVRGVVEVVLKCWDWLVKLAEHGPGWVIAQVNEAFRAAPSWLASHLLGAVEQQGDGIERFFSDWLG